MDNATPLMPGFSSEFEVSRDVPIEFRTKTGKSGDCLWSSFGEDLDNLSGR